MTKLLPSTSGEAFALAIFTIKKKKWNKKAIHYQYQIRFIGEAGIDTGGLTRDFYSSKLDVMFCTS